MHKRTYGKARDQRITNTLGRRDTHIHPSMTLKNNAGWNDPVMRLHHWIVYKIKSAKLRKPFQTGGKDSEVIVG
jgi:hypothetical protein